MEDDQDIRRRIGRFRASAKAVIKSEFRVVMASCAIVRCEHLFAQNTFEYIALSPQFGEVPEGCNLPEYKWILTQHEPLGAITAQAWRVKE